MKRATFFLFLFLINSLYADELMVVKRVYSPKDFYVGDLVTMNLHVEVPFDGTLSSPGEPPEAEWIDIKSVNLLFDGGETAVIRITFRSFAPDLRELPDIQFGDHVLREVKIPTLSILEDQFSELQPLAPQMTPTGTNILLVLLLIALLFGPYFLYLIIKTLILSIKMAVNKYRREKPFREYIKVLKELKIESDATSIRNFYVTITEQLRTYLSVRFSKEFSSATTKEMEDLLVTIMDRDSSNELLSICRFADLVKFKHSGASSMHREKDLRTIVEILYQLEGKDKKYARI